MRCVKRTTRIAVLIDSTFDSNLHSLKPVIRRCVVSHGRRNTMCSAKHFDFNKLVDCYGGRRTVDDVIHVTAESKAVLKKWRWVIESYFERFAMNYLEIVVHVGAAVCRVSTEDVIQEFRSRVCMYNAGQRAAEAHVLQADRCSCVSHRSAEWLRTPKTAKCLRHKIEVKKVI